ncbi:hypothetical protein D9613_012060 [Agrocybe pediades]|uniref:Uncharacterized protein n=1 Tax=Agrocybe pediades TaxID=84607 RepID=A0A8H4QFG0_9AGAR|nr:hypothetical protein D9613_012060 [Agrocybe pediades]
MISMPFIINGFVGSNVAQGVLNGAGWRWGYGMFAILIPATLSPLVITLLWNEWRAKKLGIVSDKDSDRESTAGMSFIQKVQDFLSRLDAFGLLLLGTAVALILLPLTLARTTAKGGWNNPSMIAMIVIGCVLVPVYAIWDTKFAKHPIIPMRFVKNRSILFAALIGGFDFISFYISYSYLYSFIVIVKPWSDVNINYFTQTQTVALTVFGIAAGGAMIYLRRSKPLMIAGLCIRLLGCGLMIHSRGANASDAEVVWSQLLQGIGGGMTAVTIQVSAQAAAPHADVAMATAVVLLITEIGGAIGSAIAGSIWTDLMPQKLALHLPFIDEETRAALYGSLTSILLLERDDPIRQGVTAAYDDVMKIMTIAATAFAVVPLILALFMPNWYLGDQQNAVENVDLKGEKVENPDVVERPSHA